MIELNYVAGAPGVSGRIRTAPEDFVVLEELGFTPTGSGEHVFLKVRKRSANTSWVAKRIATFAGVQPRAVSYAGLKDRHALAEQWFSVHLPGRTDPDWSLCREEDFTVLEQCRHSRKLKRGALRGNGFRIVVRDLRGDCGELEERLRRVAGQGVPNYFGEQRFGLDGGNLAHAEALFAGREGVKDRQQRGLYLSAARAHLFNQVLSRRVAAGSWNQLLAGEVMMLEGSHSIFTVTLVDEALRQRVETGDIHPTGFLWGLGELLSGAEVATLEQAVAAAFPLLCQGLEQAGLRQERRALRAPVRNLAWDWLEPHAVALQFRLPAGAYATAVLRELIGDAAE